MASFVGLWAGMNYEQLTSLFRVEERSVAFVSASLTNILVTVGATLLLVVVLDKGPIGVIVGNFTGTLLVYAILIGYRREQLGLQFDRHLLREMNRFGIPLVPTALFLWITNFSDRLFLVHLADTTEVGLYSVGVRIASALVLLLTAFRLAWPAFAYSIEDDAAARRAYAFVLTSRSCLPGSSSGSQLRTSRSRRVSSVRSRSRPSPSPGTSSSRSAWDEPGEPGSTGSSPARPRS
jgi:O-antigen/teichoic acid export membrane protein